MSNLPIESLIENLGFSGSRNLIYRDDFFKKSISKHDIKVLSEINPFAVYLIDNKPFILFIQSSFSETRLQNISKLIWNAQIPVAFVLDNNSVKIFNGKSIDFKTEILDEIYRDEINGFSYESEFSFYKIADPLFWDKYEKRYSQMHLNEYLLKNIMALTDILKNKYNIKFATKLVLRLIFIRYLIDRGVDLDYNNFGSDVNKSQQTLLYICKNKEHLYDLFRHLKDKFNGNLFELGDEIYDVSLTNEVFELLSEFLSGDIELGSGQMSLFAMYDFKIIPVELISNIYEILLGKETRDRDNAFYTPNYLAEYILDKVTLEFLKNNKKYKILDPSCGSGIFLVNSFKRMIDLNIGDKLFCDNDDLLKDILESNIYGIDINEDAVDITIFSLYLTILDYKNPKTLSKFRLPNLKNKNLIISDFFNDFKLESFKDIQFDFIIGNPPWGSVSDGMHLQYCKEHGHDKRQQNKEICRSFVFRAKDFSSENTTCSFVLHSKILYTQKDPSKRFRQYLLKETKILDIVEMSSVRKLVFKNADAPATVITFSYNSKNDNLKNRIVYTSLKPNMFFKLFNIIVVEKYDVKYIFQKLLYENDWAWKTIVYGFSRDIDIIKDIKNNFYTVKDLIAQEKFEYGTGIQIKGNESHDATHLKGKWYLPSRQGIDSFYVNMSKGREITEDTMRRPKVNQQQIFIPPYVLLKKGVDTKTYRYRAAFSNEFFIYSDAVTGICGKSEDWVSLYSLVGILNSSFYAYLNIMLGTSSGIEREQGFSTEIFTYPLITSEEIAKLVIEIQQMVKVEKDELFKSEIKSNELITQLDELVLNSFNLNSEVFIDYTLDIQIPELANVKGEDIYRVVTEDDLKVYIQCFAKQFASIYNKVGKGICIKLYPKFMKRYCIFELEINENISNTETIYNEAPTCNMELFTHIIRHQYNELFYQVRDVIHFTENSFYIIKPNNYKYWHPAIAEMDLGEVLDQILSDEGEVE